MRIHPRFRGRWGRLCNFWLSVYYMKHIYWFKVIVRSLKASLYVVKVVKETWKLQTLQKEYFPSLNCSTFTNRRKSANWKFSRWIRWVELPVRQSASRHSGLTVKVGKASWLFQLFHSWFHFHPVGLRVCLLMHTGI